MDDATRTLPPSELVQSIGKRKKHEELVTRQQGRNIRHEQGRGILLVLILVAATIALIWWGVTLMGGM
jgi:ferric-dicitrate binding protein FerR (iron transport regulator)